MIRTQVFEMMKMNDASLKKFLEKECKHKEEIERCIAGERAEALHNNDTELFNKLSWLYDVVRGTEVLCP